MISILPNGRAYTTSEGLTADQYRAIVSQPYSYFSKQKRSFSFIPSPYGCSKLVEAKLPLSDDLASMAQRWSNHVLHLRGGTSYDYSKSLNKTPWPHQNGAIDYAVHSPSAYLECFMGTGKSLMTIGTIAACDHRRTLIICPKSVVNVWPREFRKHSLGDFIVVPLDRGTTKKKVEEARKWIAANPSDKLVFVINFESAIQKDFAEWVVTQTWDCVVVDEAHKIKSHSGKASKLCADLKRGHPLALSGTMIPHDPLDVWAQYRFLDPAIFGSSFTAFKKKFCKLGYFNEVEEFLHLDEMQEKINLIRHHVPSTVLGLPPVTHVEYRFDLSPKVRKAYNEFKSELIAEIQDGKIVADNVLVRGLRLQQITSGFFIDDNTKNLVVLDDQSKLNAFSEWLDSVPRNAKFVVFTRFTHDLDAAIEFIRRDGRRVAELSGRRNELSADATFPEDADGVVANIASGGVGIDLTAANYGCYFSIGWNRGEYDQSGARLNRPGQTKHVTFAHLIAEDTIDTEIYAAFEEGRDLVNAVLGGLKK